MNTTIQVSIQRTRPPPPAPAIAALADEPAHHPMNLNQYGSACRCLLRLLENEGQPHLSDGAFISRFLPRYPAWQARPGLTDIPTVFELAKELELATGIEISRDYDRVLSEHRAGRAILVQTERTPVQETPSGKARPPVTLVEEMGPADFVLWCPFESGASDLLPRATRSWWETWFATGIILAKGNPI